MNIAHYPRCGWCLSIKKPQFYRGRMEKRCPCDSDHRTPIEVRRDAVLDKYGTDPDAYTPKVLKKLTKDGLLDITATFCPAGKLSMAATKAREASGMSAGTAETATQAQGEARQPDPNGETPR